MLYLNQLALSISKLIKNTFPHNNSSLFFTNNYKDTASNLSKYVMSVFLKEEIFESTLNIQRKVQQSIVVIFMTDRQTDN